MRDVLTDLVRWRAANKNIAVATVVETWGSAPREVGAKMVFNEDGAIAGSVSGGCVEGAVFDIGTEVMSGGPPRLVQFGVADETAWDVGLACGGSIQVFIQTLNPDIFDPLAAAINDDEPLVKGTITAGPTGWIGREGLHLADGRQVGSYGEGLDLPVAQSAIDARRGGKSVHGTLDVSSIDGLEGFAGEKISILFEVHLPPPAVVMVGGVHIAVGLTRIANTLGYRTIVIDPRRAFATAERFSEADLMLTAWPDEAFESVPLTETTAVAMLTHDPKIDDPALKIVLRSPVFYVGALGSRQTQQNRRERLLADGLSVTQIDRIQGPIGLPLGGRTPEEIALAIMAQIVAARHRNLDRSGRLS